MNDIFELSASNNLVAFADDTALLCENEEKEHVFVEASEAVTLVDNWLQDNLLTLNIKKCNFINFTLRNQDTVPNCLVKHSTSCNNKTSCSCPLLEQLDEIKYLGVILDKNLNWKCHIRTIANKLRAFLCKVYFLRKHVSEDTLKTFYFALVQSVLQYSIVCWGGTYLNAIKPLLTLQKKIIRTMTYKARREHTLPIFQKLHILPVRYLYIYRVLLDYYKKKAYTSQTVFLAHIQLEVKLH